MQKTFNISEKTKYFVYCPAGIVTGGAELLHQLVDVLNRNGGNAYIVYYGSSEHRIPNDYKKYNINLADSIDDSEENIVVIFEGYFKSLFNISKAQVLLWWLSVDNYYYTQLNNLKLFDLFRFNKLLYIRQFIKRIFRRDLLKNRGNVFSLKMLRENSLVKCNAYQSEYAKDFLTKKGFKQLHPLKDYINSDYNFDLTTRSHREDMVLYNPKKGFRFTEKLIKRSPDLNWVPIKNMNRLQVKELMEKSKIYIDFGYHPGKDRMPREAAMSGCCIITGKQGSAGYEGDISIDSSNYKFNQRNKDVEIILNKIRWIINHYDTEILNFETYRNNIAKEKLEFEKDAMALLLSKAES